MSAFSFRRLLRALGASIVLTVAFSGCSQQPPAPVVFLEILADGSYRLQGVPVKTAALKHELEKLNASVHPLELRIVGDPGLNYKVVGAALQTVQDAGIARVGFAKDTHTK